MENYNVMIKLTDCCCCKGNTTTNTTQTIMNNSKQFIDIQCGYTFRIMQVNSNDITFSISNGYLYIIRKGYLYIPQYINLGDGCVQHILTIEVVNISA